MSTYSRHGLAHRIRHSSCVRGRCCLCVYVVVVVPVSVPISAVVRQAMSLAGGNLGKVDYAVQGRLNGPMFGGASFKSTGEFALPAAASEAAGR